MSSEAVRSDVDLQIRNNNIIAAVDASVEGSSLGYHSVQDFQGFQNRPTHRKNTKLFQLDATIVPDITETNLFSAISEKSADGDFISLSCPEASCSEKTSLLTDEERSFLRFLDDMKNLKAKDVDTAACQFRGAAWPRKRIPNLSVQNKNWPLFNSHHQLMKTEEQEHQKETNSNSDGEELMDTPPTVISTPVFVRMQNGQESVKRALLLPAEIYDSLSPVAVEQDSVTHRTSPHFRPPSADADNIIYERELSFPENVLDNQMTHSRCSLALESQEKDLSRPSDQTGSTCSTGDALQNWSHHGISVPTVQHTDNPNRIIVHPAKNDSKSHCENNDHLRNVPADNSDISKGTVRPEKEDIATDVMSKDCLAKTDQTTDSVKAFESIQECVMPKVCNPKVIDNATQNLSILNSSENTLNSMDKSPVDEESSLLCGTAGPGLDRKDAPVVVSCKEDQGDYVFKQQGLIWDTQNRFRTALQDNYQRNDVFSVMDFCTSQAQGDIGRKTSIASDMQQTLVGDFGNTSEVWRSEPADDLAVVPADDLAVVPNDDLAVVPDNDLAVVPADDLAVVLDPAFAHTGDNFCQSKQEDSFYDDCKENRPKEKNTCTTVPNFKWKYRPSCNVEEDIVCTPAEALEQGLGNIQPLPSAACSRGIRLGLSRKQRVKRLHYSSI